MYQPYLRGKQFELLALEELAEPLFSVNKELISPIIEPVRDSTTLQRTLKVLARFEINFTIIINPTVGDFVDLEQVKIFQILNNIITGYENFQCGIIFNEKTDHSSIINLLNEFNFKNLTLIHYNRLPHIEEILSLYSESFSIKYNVLNIQKVRDRYKRQLLPKGTFVELDDFFEYQDRNKDYPEISSFSEEHLYYIEEGYIGISDYLCVGEPYSETGFMPFAIAIHVSFEADDGSIKVRHFVSDTNDDRSNIAGKFQEALDKLVTWANAHPEHHTSAIDQFKDLHERGHFPGLGYIKKLSILNHLELVITILSKTTSIQD